MNEISRTRGLNRDRLTYIGIWVVATVAYIGFAVAGYPALGAGAFLILGASTFALGRPERMFDERDTAIVKEASANTIQVIGLISAIVFPVTAALAGFGYVEWPMWLAGASLVITVQFALWVGFLLLARRRR